MKQAELIRALEKAGCPIKDEIIDSSGDQKF